MLTQKHFNSRFPLLGFAARSGTGKTTLLKHLIPLLKSNGLRLGLIKHTHHKVVFDNAGLTRQLFERGVDVYADSDNLSIYESHDKHSQSDDGEELLRATVNNAQTLPLDLMLVEGFKNIAFNKIELHRTILNQPLLCHEDSSIIAVASDVPAQINALKTGCAVLDLNNINEIYQWIVETYLAQHGR